MDASRGDLQPPADQSSDQPSRTLPPAFASLFAFFLELIPAAKRLANDQLAQRHITKTYVCVGCGNASADKALICHSADCAVGEVFRLLRSIEKERHAAVSQLPIVETVDRVPARHGFQASETVFRLLRSIEKELHAAVPRSPIVETVDRGLRRHGFHVNETFYEPWKVAVPADDTDVLIAVDALGNTVVDMYGATLPEDEELRYVRRIVASVNFCQGMPTEEMERMLAAGVSQ